MIRTNAHETSHDVYILVFGCKPEGEGLMLPGRLPRVRACGKDDLNEGVIAKRCRKHEAGESLFS